MPGRSFDSKDYMPSSPSQSSSTCLSPPLGTKSTQSTEHSQRKRQSPIQNMDDLLEKRERKFRNEGNWIDEEGEDFMRDYLNLPSPLSPTLPQLRERRELQLLPIGGPPSALQPTRRDQNSWGKRSRANWTDDDLKQAIVALDVGYTMREVCEAHSIPKTSLRDHYNGMIKSRKMGPQSIFTKEEEDKIVAYIVEMGRLAHPLSPNDLKLKVAKMCQTRETPFIDGILGRSWLKLFQKRHPTLVFRVPQPLKVNRARNLCPSMVHTFYSNLEHLYKQENYQPSHIWNVDESGANAGRNGM